MARKKKRSFLIRGTREHWKRCRALSSITFFVAIIKEIETKRGGEKNEKEARRTRGEWKKKKKENCRRKIFALPVDKRWQIINNGLVYVAVRGRSFASQFCPDSWLDHRLPRENRFLFFETTETKLYFTFKIIVSRFDKIILTRNKLAIEFFIFISVEKQKNVHFRSHLLVIIILPNRRVI